MALIFKSLVKHNVHTSIGIISCNTTNNIGNNLFRKSLLFKKEEEMS